MQKHYVIAFLWLYELDELDELDVVRKVVLKAEITDEIQVYVM
jgi:hypothetical protein